MNVRVFAKQLTLGQHFSAGIVSGTTGSAAGAGREPHIETTAASTAHTEQETSWKTHQ